MIEKEVVFVLTNEQLIQKLEAAKQEIAYQIAETLIQRQVTQYMNMSLTQAQRIVLIPLNMILHYFCTDDIDALKAEIQTRTTNRIKQGVSVEDVQLATEIIAEGLEQAITKIMEDDDSNASLIASYQNRLKIIKALSKVSVAINKMKETD